MSSWLLQTPVEDSGRLRPVAFKSSGWTRVLKQLKRNYRRWLGAWHAYRRPNSLLFLALVVSSFSSFWDHILSPPLVRCPSGLFLYLFESSRTLAPSMDSSFDSLSLGICECRFPDIVTAPDWTIFIPRGLLFLLGDLRPYTHGHSVSF